MKDFREEVERIKELLQSHPEGMSITDISSTVSINRNSVAKYLDIMQAQGMAVIRRVGPAKIYHSSQRVAEGSIQRFCTDPFLIINPDMKICGTSDCFSDVIPISPALLHSSRIDEIPLGLGREELHAIIKASFRGAEQRREISFKASGIEFEKVLTIIPVVQADGKPGLVLIFQDKNRFRPGESMTTEDPVPAFIDPPGEYFVKFQPDGRITYANVTYCLALGRTKEEIVGNKFRPIIPAEDVDKVKKHFQSLTMKHPVATVEHRAIVEEGNVRWHRWTNRALFDSNGEVVECQSIGQDITDKKILEQKLNKSQRAVEDAIRERTHELREVNRQLYQEISNREKMEQALLFTQFAIDHASDLLFWVNRHGQIIYSNQHAIEFLGYKSKEIAILSIWDVVSGLSLEQWDSFWKEIIEHKMIRFERDMIKSDRSMAPVDIAVNYLIYNNKEHQCWFVRDMTEHKRIERALKESQEKYRALVETTDDIVWQMDEKGRVLYVNPGTVKTLGYSCEELTGDAGVLLLIPGEEKFPSEQAHLDAGEKGNYIRYTKEILTKDGRYRILDTKLTPITGPEDEITGYRGISRDITERYESEQALNAANRKLNLISSLVRHEIMNKITATLGFLNRSRKRITDPTVLGYLEHQENSILGIRKMVEFTRDFKDMGMKSPIWQDLNSVIENAWNQNRDKKIHLFSRIENLEVFADPLLERAFFQFFQNTIMHGEKATDIWIDFTDAPTGGIIRVRDNGKGIPDEDKSGLFDIKFRKGSGYGLFMVREILSLTGITICEQGTYGEGAEFIINIQHNRYRLLEKETRPPGPSQ